MGARRQQEGLSEIPCRTCGKSFLPYRDYVVTCSRKCREQSDRSDLPTVEVQFTCEACARPSVGYTRSAGGGQFRYCDACKPAAAKVRAERKNVNRRVANDPTAHERNRRQLLSARYKMTPEQYDAMLAEQNGACALCARPPKPDGVRASSRLHVDHDHETGKIRALLCNNCNRAIGYFKDDPDLMQRASLYVWKHRQQAAD